MWEEQVQVERGTREGVRKAGERDERRIEAKLLSAEGKKVEGRGDAWDKGRIKVCTGMNSLR